MILITHVEVDRDLFLGGDVIAKFERLDTLRLNDTGKGLAGEELIEMARGCQVVVADSTVSGTAEVFGACPELAAFVRPHVDMRNIDVEAASAHGILVTHTSAGFGAAVAELVLGFMVDLSRGITASTIAYQSGGSPGASLGRQLSGSTLGVIGYGHIGRYLSCVASALGMQLLVHDPYVDLAEETRRAPPRFPAAVRQVQLDVLLQQADFIVPLAAATPDTRNMIDAAALAQVKDTAFLINVSRGDLVDEAALAEALDAGAIAGAALDVGMAERQRPPPRLASRANVICTPHIGGLTPEAVRHQALEAVDQIAMILEGQVPPGAVNGERAERLARLIP